MGKVFNDEIVKILCAKNIQKDPNVNPDTSLSSSKCSSVKRGESYVVFLDKQHRKELQRQIVGLERYFKASADTSLCAMHQRPLALTSGGTAMPNSWVEPKRKPKQKQKQTPSEQTQDLKARIRKGMDSVINRLKHPFHYRKQSQVLAKRYRDNNGREQIQVTPACFGPFPDESFCASFDRLYYCVCILLGIELEPLDFGEALEALA